jgi:hypothetical protein
MPVPVFAEDLELAVEVMSRTNVLSAQEQLRDAIALALATERERCATIADHYAQANLKATANEISSAIAKLIRAPRTFQ